MEQIIRARDHFFFSTRNDFSPFRTNISRAYTEVNQNQQRHHVTVFIPPPPPPPLPSPPPTGKKITAATLSPTYSILSRRTYFSSWYKLSAWKCFSARLYSAPRFRLFLAFFVSNKDRNHLGLLGSCIPSFDKFNGMPLFTSKSYVDIISCQTKWSACFDVCLVPVSFLSTITQCRI